MSTFPSRTPYPQQGSYSDHYSPPLPPPPQDSHRVREQPTHAPPFDRYDYPTIQPPVNPYTNLILIKNASRQTLLASENAVFLELLEENVTLKSELKVAKNALLSQKENLRAHAEPVTENPGLGAAHRPLTIQVPPSPPPCMRDDFPGVKIWTRADWAKEIQNSAAKGVHVKKLAFITDENGKAVDDKQLAVMAKEARTAWATLHYYRLSPENWSGKITIAGDFFSNYMRTKFPELRWCDNDWKVDAYGTVKYPEWKPTRDGGNLLRQNPSMKLTAPPAKIKKEKPSGFRQTQPPPSQKRRHVDSDIIELDSDSDSEQNRKEKKRRTQNTKTTLPISAPADSTDPASSSTTSPPIGPPLSVNAAPAPSFLGSGDQQSPRETGEATYEAASPQLAPQAALRTPSSSAPVVPSPFNSTPAPSPAAAPVAAPAPAPTSALALPSTPLGPGAPPASTESETAPASFPNPLARSTRARAANILSNMDIPTPDPSLISHVKESNNPSVSTVSQGGKGEKLVKDNGTTSARNLYGIDYVKMHGPTTAAAFKVIWDGLDSETAKKYKALSAAAKKKA